MEVRQTIPNRWCIKVSLRDGFCWPRSVYEWRNDITNRGEWASSGYLNHNGVWYANQPQDSSDGRYLVELTLEQFENWIINKRKFRLWKLKK
jgi:hypothetical protein